MDATRFAVAATREKAMEEMMAYSGKSQKLYIAISASKNLREIAYELSTAQLTELHVTITETGDNDVAEISQLYEMSKNVRLGMHPLAAFSVTYHANNTDSSNNAARFMILSNLLGQLNWDICVKTELNLHVNYLQNDPRLELLDELPINVCVLGVTGHTKDSVTDDIANLKMLSQAYSYLDGYL